MDNDSNDNDGDEVLEEEAAEDDVEMQKPRQQSGSSENYKTTGKGNTVVLCELYCLIKGSTLG